MIKGSFFDSLPPALRSLVETPGTDPLSPEALAFLLAKLQALKGIIYTQSEDIQLKLFDVDSRICSQEFDTLASNLSKAHQILLCDKIKLVYGFDALISFIVRLVNVLNFSQFFSIFDITSNIKLYGFYSLNYKNPVEILVKQIRHDLFIVKSFKEFTIQEMKKEHDFHLPYKEFKRLNLNDGNLVVVKILFKNEQKPIDLQLIKQLLPKIQMLHLSLENESKLRPFNDIIDESGSNLKYLKFGVNRGTFKRLPCKNSIETLKLVNIDNLNFINDLKSCNSLDVFFDNWELRKNSDVRFHDSFIINFNINQTVPHLKTLNIFHTYLNSHDLNKLNMFPNLTHSKISYVILDNEGFDLSRCTNLQELKIHFTYHKLHEDENFNPSNIKWPPNLKKLSITIHNIKNLVQNFSIRLNILRKISAPLPPSIVDLCIDISYDTGGSGPESYSISRDDILKISSLINNILTNNLENLKLKGISRYNYKIGKPLIFSAINFPKSLKLLSLNDFILDFNFISLPNLKKLYFEHSLFDSEFKLPDSDEILIEKCTFKDLSHLPPASTKIEFKMCTFRKIPSYGGSIDNVIINNCRVMDQTTNNVFQFQQQGQQMATQNTGSSTKSFQQSYHSPLLHPQYTNSSYRGGSQPQIRTQSLPYINHNSLTPTSAHSINDFYPPHHQPMLSSQSFSSQFFDPAQNSVPTDLNAFLTKDLEFQLSNMSLDQSMMLNMNVTSPPGSSPSTTGATYQSQIRSHPQTPNNEINSFHMSSRGAGMGSLSNLINQFGASGGTSPESSINMTTSPQFGYQSNRNSFASTTLNPQQQQQQQQQGQQQPPPPTAANLSSFIDDFSLNNNSTWSNLNADSPFNT